MLKVEMGEVVFEQALIDPGSHLAVDPAGADLARQLNAARRHDIFDFEPASLVVKVDLFVCKYFGHETVPVPSKVQYHQSLAQSAQCCNFRGATWSAPIGLVRYQVTVTQWLAN